MKKLSIQAKLMMIVIPLTLVLIVSTGIYTLLVRYAATQSKTMYFEELYQTSTEMINADRDFYQAYSSLLMYIVMDSYNIIGNDAQAEEFMEKMQNAKDCVARVQALAAKYPKLMSFSYEGMSMQQQLDEFEQNMEELDHITATGLHIMMLDNFYWSFSATRDNINHIEVILEQYAIAGEAELSRNLSVSIIATIAVAFVLIVAVLIFAVIIIQFIRKGITHVTEEITYISEKDLTHEMDVIDGKDEIAQLSRAARSLQRQLLRVMGTLQASSGSLSTTSNEMAANTKTSVASMQSVEKSVSELAGTAAHQAEYIAQIVNEIGRINEMAKLSSESTQSLSDACTYIDEVSKNGMMTVHELTEVTEQSMSAFDSIFKVIEGIDERTKTIGIASDMITDIASQTNLLSLNASIEAARAGEAGKGFAVVADEIRKLAEQSASSASTINTMLSELLTSANEASEESKSVKVYVERQRQSVMNTRDGFESIVSNLDIVKEGTVNLREINTDLGNKVTAISGLLDSLSASSEENASTAEQLSEMTTTVTQRIRDLEATGDSVNSSADELSMIVSDYQI